MYFTDGVQRPELGVIYTIGSHLCRYGEYKEFDSSWLFIFVRGYRFKQVPIPTTILIKSAGFNVPDMLRVYDCRLSYYNGKIVDRKELVDAVKESGEEWSGFYDHPTVVLKEVWEDNGDDGHIDNQIVGWKFEVLDGDFYSL